MRQAICLRARYYSSIKFFQIKPTKIFEQTERRYQLFSKLQVNPKINNMIQDMKFNIYHDKTYSKMLVNLNLVITFQSLENLGVYQNKLTSGQKNITSYRRNDIVAIKPL